MTTSHWRLTAQRVIRETLKHTQDLPAPERLRQIDAAYPFGPREYYPYEVWLEERRKAMQQLGIPPKQRQRTCRVVRLGAPVEPDAPLAAIATPETDSEEEVSELDRPHLRARPAPCLARTYGVVGTPVPMSSRMNYQPRNDPTLHIWLARKRELLAEAEARGDVERAAWLRQVLGETT